MHQLLLILLILTAALPARALDCKSIRVRSMVVQGREETIDLCFLNDESYFITRGCIDLSCNFVRKLRSTALSSNETERPGETYCKQLEGAVEEVKISNKENRIRRCIFTKDRNSISLNLLESWNGKHFSGPAPTVKFN